MTQTIKNKPSIIKIDNKEVIVKSGDIFYISLSGHEKAFKARFINLKKRNIANVFVLDKDHNMIDIEVNTDKIIKIEKPN